MSNLIARIERFEAAQQQPAPAPLAPPPAQVAPAPVQAPPPAPAPVLAPVPPPVELPIAHEPGAEPGYPGVKVVKGARIMLNAPVSPYWEPPMSAHVFGSYGAHVSDPSNAPPGKPNRSANGFPLIYPGLHWDAAKGEWAGTPIGPARYHCGESSYETEAEAMAEGRRIAERRGEPVDPGWALAHERMKQGGRQPAPPAAPQVELPPGETPL